MDRQELLKKLATELDERPACKSYMQWDGDAFYPTDYLDGNPFKKQEWLAERERLAAKPEAPGWDGEGLPPVGVECELAVCVMASFDDLEAMREVPEGERVFISGRADFGYGESAVYGGFLDGIWFYGIHKAAAFRPIRSEEERRTDEAMQIIDANPDDFANVRGVVQRMIAAGYRKQ